MNSQSPSPRLAERKIILGVTGSIAAYKAAYLTRALIKEGAEVQVVMTPAAKEFITPLTLSTLSRKPVVSEFFSRRDGSWHSHVDLGLWADAMLIAPATAATIGKMAQGVADNMLVTTYLSCKAPVFVAPAMDLDMYAHPATQANIARLRTFGNRIIEPAEGELANEVGDLRGRTVLITAGPTYEKIDPVRFIGNYSSGKMGFALAEACARRGAEVQLVAGPVALSTTHPHITRTDVESADEMYDAATALFPGCDIAILAAAVADYRPHTPAEVKIKREETGHLTLPLVSNRDIAAALGRRKRPDQRLVGFALETNDERAHAEEKLRRKRLDLIVLNSLQDAGAGFGVDTNKITVIDTLGNARDFPLKSKTELADDIIDCLLPFLPPKNE